MSEPTPLSAEPRQEPDFLSWLVARAEEDSVYDAATLFPQAVEYGRQCEAEIRRKDATIDAQATEIAALKGALENLMDEQNGPPLIRDAASWQVAMDNARRVLARKEAKE